MRFVIHLLLALSIALAVGFGLSWYALTDGRLFGAQQDGPWSAWPQVGSSAHDPYTRAYLSRTGALQLGQSEGLAFVASTDSQGQPLDRACTYFIDGTTPIATFWTLVALDADGVNIARPGTDPAMHSARLARSANGTTNIYVGKALAPQNWLEINGSGPFSLVLTFYDVSTLSGVGPGASATLPPIVRKGCP